MIAISLQSPGFHRICSVCNTGLLTHWQNSHHIFTFQPKRLTHLTVCAIYVLKRSLAYYNVDSGIANVNMYVWWCSCFTAFPFNSTKLCWCYWCIVKKLNIDSLAHLLQKTEDISIKILYQCCHQSHSFWLKYAPNRSAAGGSPQTPSPHWGSSQRSPDPLAAEVGVEGEGKEGREEEGWEGKGRVGRLPPLVFKSGYALGNNGLFENESWITI